MRKLKLISFSLILAASTAATAQSVETVLEGGKAVAAKSSRGLLSGILGCSAAGSKQVIGAAGGGAVGGLLGGRIAGKGSRTLGTIAGATTGAAVGSALGCKLQRNDQARAEQATQRALASNQPQSWRNAETGASGQVDVLAAPPNSTLGDLKLASQVQPATTYQKVAANYVATSQANIRSAPSLAAPIIGQLAAGQRVWVPASTGATVWMLVADNGVGKGYVAAALLKQTVGASAGCKLVKQTVSVPGSTSETENLEACKGDDGNWVLKRV